MKVHIIGSGIIGLFSAYYLHKAGCEVTIIEQTDGNDGCSYGNAGMIVPSHFIPLAAPGMLSKGFQWMFDSSSPFYIKPRLDWSLVQWGIGFMRAANQKKVKQFMPVLRDISLWSKQLYQEIASEKMLDFGFEQNGLLMLCKTEHTLEEEAHTAQIANQLGIAARVLTRTQVHELEPELKPEVAGGVMFEGDTHCMPNLLVKNLKEYLYQRGVEFLYNARLENILSDKNQISELWIDQKGESLKLKTEQVVLAAGSWSEQLAKTLKLKLPIQAGKGYSFTEQQKEQKKLNTPSILTEARVAVSPFQHQIRFGGTMELGGINSKINMLRVKGIVEAVNAYFPDYELAIPKKENVWQGLRPCSPDGLPYIGGSGVFKNLCIATGHAMMGISLAPATGKMVTEACLSKPLSIASSLLSPDRFSK